MVNIIKEDISKNEKQELIKQYEEKLKDVDKRIDLKFDLIIDSIFKMKNQIKQDIVTEEISSFYVDTDDLSLKDEDLSDDIESEQMIKEVNNFILMSNDDIDYIIEDNVMKVFNN